MTDLTDLDGSHNKRHWLFAVKYIELGHNGSKAYRAVYDPDGSSELSDETCKTNGSRLLSHANVKGYVKDLERDAADAARVTVESVVSRYQRWASFDPRDVFGWEMVEQTDSEGKPFDPPVLKPQIVIKEMENVPPEAWECIESVEQGKDGFKVKVVDKKGSNDKLAQILGITKDSLMIGGIEGKPVETVAVSEAEIIAARKKMLEDDDC